MKICFKFLFFLLFAHSLDATEIPAVGAKVCASCHTDIYQDWMKSKHSKAHLALSASDQNKALCKSCHKPSLLGVSQSQRNHRSISCEHCHGKGYFYQHGFIMKDPEVAKMSGLKNPLKSCVKCHDNKKYHFDHKIDLKELLKNLKVHDFGKKDKSEQKSK